MATKHQVFVQKAKDEQQIQLQLLLSHLWPVVIAAIALISAVLLLIVMEETETEISSVIAEVSHCGMMKMKKRNMRVSVMTLMMMNATEEIEIVTETEIETETVSVSVIAAEI